MTVHKSQGSTFTNPFSIDEYKSMKSRMLYVAITRAKHNKQINFCDSECHKAYTGHVYCYEYNGKFYIGSTVNFKKENKDTKTAQNQVVLNFNTQSNYMDFDNFKYMVLQTIQYSNICELWELEDTYIKTYNSIDNGYNYRFNRNKKCNI